MACILLNLSSSCCFCLCVCVCVCVCVCACSSFVKARRVKLMTQLQPIKLNLRFLFGLLMDQDVMQAPELQTLTRLSVCQALASGLENRAVGSGRTHALFLLVKKVLVYLSSVVSTQRHQFLPPTMYESYTYVESICSGT
jgi:hypothetical protein